MTAPEVSSDSIVGRWIPAAADSRIASLQFTTNGRVLQTLTGSSSVNEGTWWTLGNNRFECELQTLGFGVPRDIIRYEVTQSTLVLEQVSGDSWLLSTLTPRVEFKKAD